MSKYKPGDRLVCSYIFRHKGSKLRRTNVRIIRVISEYMNCYRCFVYELNRYDNIGGSFLYLDNQLISELRDEKIENLLKSE